MYKESYGLPKKIPKIVSFFQVKLWNRNIYKIFYFKWLYFLFTEKISMKITICGSLKFAKDILSIKKQLEDFGHEVRVPLETEAFAAENTNNDWQRDARQGMLDHYDNIAYSDAVLVTNFDKNWTVGYIWWATLVDMGIACYLRKKIFILNPVPKQEEIRYVQEINLMLPIILNWNLSKIQ